MSMVFPRGRNPWHVIKKPIQHPMQKRKHSSTSRLQDHVTLHFEAPPPGSNENTSVWFWTEDGRSTTVMLTKISGEVWCNGRILQTTVGFTTDNDATETGDFVDFIIPSSESGTKHHGCLRRLKPTEAGKAHDKASHSLYVDGQLVPEHTIQRRHSMICSVSAEALSELEGFAMLSLHEHKHTHKIHKK